MAFVCVQNVSQGFEVMLFSVATKNFLFFLPLLKLIVVSLVPYYEHDLLVILGANTSFRTSKYMVSCMSILFSKSFCFIA